MRKLILFTMLVGGGLLATKKEKAIYLYKYYSLNSELKSIYSRSRELERLGKYIEIKESKWTELQSQADRVRKEIKELKRTSL